MATANPGPPVHAGNPRVQSPEQVARAPRDDGITASAAQHVVPTGDHEVLPC